MIIEVMYILHNSSKFPENVTILQQLDKSTDLLTVVNWYRKFAKSNHVRTVAYFTCSIMQKYNFLYRNNTNSSNSLNIQYYNEKKILEKALSKAQLRRVAGCGEQK